MQTVNPVGLTGSNVTPSNQVRSFNADASSIETPEPKVLGAVLRTDSLYEDTENGARYSEFVRGSVCSMQKSVLEEIDVPARVGDVYFTEDDNGDLVEQTHTKESIVGAKVRMGKWNVQIETPKGLMKRQLVLEGAIDARLRAKAISGDIAGTPVQVTIVTNVFQEDTKSTHPDRDGVFHTYAKGSKFQHIGKIDPIAISVVDMLALMAK